MVSYKKYSKYNTYVLQMTDQWPPHPIKQVLPKYYNNNFFYSLLNFYSPLMIYSH